ncbi:MAG: aminodeoxychorismate synthase component I [Pseudomonadota bacterium]
MNPATSGSVAIEVKRLETVPNLLSLHRQDPKRFAFLLQSTALGGSAQRTLGQFDILFCEPGDAIVVPFDAAHDAPSFFDTLNALAPEVARDGPRWIGDPVPAGGLPFFGGWFVFAAYELAAQVEPTLSLTRDPSLPMALAVRVRSAVVVCRSSAKAWLVAEESIDCGLLKAVSTGGDTSHATMGWSTDSLVERIDEDRPEPFLHAVGRAREHIAAGDVFQANLSRRWCARLRDDVSSADVYERLCQTNAAPFAGLMTWRGTSVLSSSPERLAELRYGRIDTRPIAGTRPRGAGTRNDRALSRELIRHPKERAEHVMLIDLERNDIGRVCKPGTVAVDEFMVIESYAHVHHIVSNVSGELDAGVGPGDALRAVYPGGTITGCPKVRCMDIIADLEEGPRGAYTGGMGYLNRDGSGDMNILIRTLVIRDGEATFRAGAGIVADSVAEAELAETRAKARGMVLALTGNDA